jgi:hypothetical protein
VIILDWNGWEDTFDCLRSLAAASDVTAVWLVDIGSNTNRSDEALALWPGLRLISLNQNEGSDVNGNALYYRLRNLFLLGESAQGFARIQRNLDACHKAADAGDRLLIIVLRVLRWLRGLFTGRNAPPSPDRTSPQK